MTLGMTANGVDTGLHSGHAKQPTTIPKLIPRRKLSQPSTQSDPAPETPALPAPPPLESIHFTTPVKRILSQADHQKFLHSSTYSLIQAWMFTLADSVRGRTISSLDVQHLSARIKKLDAVLDVFEGLLHRFPPLDTGSRFGNPVFRSLHKAIVRDVDKIHKEVLGLDNEAAIQEISVYLINCFGSEERLDYGSGHELNFMMWLLCLYQLKQIEREDFPAVVMHTFVRYLELMRKIQSTYYLEPAGSHGVWGSTTTNSCHSCLGRASSSDTPTSRPNQSTIMSC